MTFANAKFVGLSRGDAIAAYQTHAYSLYIYISNNNNNWLQHPNNKGTRGCAPGPAMVN